MPFRSKHFGFAALGALLLGGILSGCGGGGGGATTVSEEQRIVAANSQFRSRVASLLTSAAAEFGVAIEPDRFASIAYTDGAGVQIAVNTPIAGVESLTIEELRQGADVLFSFVRFRDGVSGFFVTRIRQENGAWVAEMRTLAGQTRTTNVTVTTDSGGANLRPIATVDWFDEEKPCFDLRRGLLRLIFCRMDVDPLKNLFEARTSQGGYERQLTDTTNEAIGIVRNSLVSRSRDSSSGISLVSRDDILFAAQLHEGVSNWTTEDLTTRSLMTLFVDGGAQPRLSANGRILPLQLRNANGAWTAQGMPEITVNITIKTKSSPRYCLADLEGNMLRVFSVLSDREVVMEVPL